MALLEVMMEVLRTVLVGKIGCPLPIQRQECLFVAPTTLSDHLKPVAVPRSPGNLISVLPQVELLFQCDFRVFTRH